MSRAKQQARIEAHVMRSFTELDALHHDYIEAIARPFEEAVEDFALAASDALYGPEIRRLEQLIEGARK